MIGSNLETIQYMMIGKIIVSFLNNVPNLAVGCIIQNRILVHLLAKIILTPPTIIGPISGSMVDPESFKISIM